MGRIKNEGQLHVAKCILNDYPPAKSKFRGIDLDQFTSIELAKIIDMTSKYPGNTPMQPTKVKTTEFKEGDYAWYGVIYGTVHDITNLSAVFRQPGNMSSQVVGLKDLKLDTEPVYLPKQEPVSFQKGQRVWFKCDPYRISNVVGKDAKICNGNNTLCVKVKDLTLRD